MKGRLKQLVSLIPMLLLGRAKLTDTYCYIIHTFSNQQ